ncbi:MAG: hypothetical protein ACJ77K_03585 [Bacteroidia bacterium]
MTRLLPFLLFFMTLISSVAAQDTAAVSNENDELNTISKPREPSEKEAALNDFILQFSRQKIHEEHHCYIAFKNVSVLDAENNKLRKHRTVIVEDGWVKEIRISFFTFSLKGAKIIDGKGKVLAPALTDMHVHFTCTNRDRLQYLLYGVTTIRNMSGYEYHLRDKSFISSGDILSPELYTCGPEFSGTDTSGFWQAVTDQQNAGYDFLKSSRSMNKESLLALLDYAKNAGMKVTVELPAGVTPASLSMYKDMITIDGYTGISNGKKVKLNENDSIWYCPAFASGSEVIRTKALKDFLDKPEYSMISDKQALIAERSSRDIDLSLSSNFKSKKSYYGGKAKKGLRILAGTESGLPLPMLVPGPSLHNEMKELIQLGFKINEAILAATRNPAIVIADEYNSGRIREKERTGLVLLDEDPLENIENYKKIEGVYVNGTWLSSEDLKVIRAKLEQIK